MAETRSATPRQAPEHFSIEQAQHELFRQWGGDRDTKEDALFPGMTAMFVFCASLGHVSSVRRPLKGKKTILFRWSQLSADTDLPLLESIAIEQTGNMEVAADPYEIMQIAQECAAGGVDLLRSKLLGNREKNLLALGALTLELTKHTKPPESG
jgi:hypothetical protein